MSILRIFQPINALIISLIVSTASLAGAFAFQYIGGLQPCVLCIWQRWPYVVAIILAAFMLLIKKQDLRKWGLGLIALTFLVGAGIAGYHIGVEQHWWVGTPSCGVSLRNAQTAEELIAQLQQSSIIRCDEPVWTLLGISMAGYNFILSVLMSGFAFISMRRAK